MTTVSVPQDAVGLLIGPQGSNIKRLMRSTGCKIDVPKRGTPAAEGSEITVTLSGDAKAIEKAQKNIKELIETGCIDDIMDGGDGAMIITHNLPTPGTISWAGWRLIGVEHEHNVRAEIGKQAIRIFANDKAGIQGPAAAALKKAAEEVIDTARGLEESIVAVRAELSPDNVKWDAACAPLVEQWGILVEPGKIEGRNVVSVLGPQAAARDVSALIEAKYVKGKVTSSVLITPTLIEDLPADMAEDFQRDLKALSEEEGVKVTRGAVSLRLTGKDEEAVARTRGTLRDMLAFYLPEKVAFQHSLKPSFLEMIREDNVLKGLRARTDSALALDDNEGSVWACGEAMKIVKEKVDALMKRWEVEHWEMELPHFTDAYWLLGPKGTGECLARMARESGAKMKVCPNAQMVWVDGPGAKVEVAKELVLKALKVLEEKRKENPEQNRERRWDEDRGPPPPPSGDKLVSINRMWAVLDTKGSGTIEGSKLTFIRGMLPRFVPPGTDIDFEPSDFFKNYKGTTGPEVPGTNEKPELVPGTIEKDEFVNLMASILQDIDEGGGSSGSTGPKPDEEPSQEDLLAKLRENRKRKAEAASLTEEIEAKKASVMDAGIYD